MLVVHFARIILPELVRGESVTTRATAGNPLDPDDVIDVPEPEPVEPAGETDAEADVEADADIETDVDEQPQQSPQPSDDGTVEDE